MTIEVRPVDYENQQQGIELIELMDVYATDIMGGGQALDESIKAKMVSEMAKRPFVRSAIAYVDGQPAGLINFIEGFSTFAAQPLLNVHDVVVRSDFRRQGVSRKLFEYVEIVGKELGCCKITLEVLEFNQIACQAYKNFGFKPYRLSDDGGVAQFWQKKIV